jgi:RHS repeat-associated protein
MDSGGTAPGGIRLPSGGGAVSGIGSDFATNLNTGAGSYAVPIQLPSGHRGQAPQLVLQYSSGVGSDAFGLGWSLGSLEIRRDGRNGIPAYRPSDGLLLNGEELVDVGGGILRPRVDPSLQRVRRSGAGWEVTDRQGTRFLLGLTAQAQERHPDRAGPDAMLAWHLERVEDTSGNVTAYTYLRDQERLYLHRIDYAVHRFEIEYEQRPDPRTVRRGGFAQRTAWRASRLGIHRPALTPSLLRAYDLAYAQDPVAGHSLLTGVTLTGFLPGADGELAAERAPALRFAYSSFDPGRRQIHTLRAADHDGPPGLADGTVDVADLDGFGLPGVLQATATSHRYWANRGDGSWSPPVRLRHFPEGVSLADRRVRLADVDGDARPDLVVSDAALSGWYPGRAGRAWGNRRPARTGPATDVRDERVRIYDADGDGRADVVQATDRALLVYERGDGDGWSALARVVPRRRDDPTFPDVAFDDPRVRLADLSGDGMLDLVRVWGRHLEVWPSLGPTRWDARQVRLLPGGGPTRFDPRRCQLADVNGDGLTDVVYVDDDVTYVWVNRGESMAEPIRLTQPPPAAVATIRTADMLGTGTAGLLFSVRGGPGARDSYRFLDLTGGAKPYLLTGIDNGVGKQTTIGYGSSAAHRVRDRDAGADWPTFLPRAVQVVDLIEHRDVVTGRSSTMRMRYHDGHYDPRAQRFAGFARVDTLETYGEGTAPVLTRSSFHVGLPGDRPGVESGRVAALRGQLHRRETLSPDGTAAAERPYLVESTEWTVTVAATGPGGAEVLFPLPARRSIERWERGEEPSTVVTELTHDEFGCVLRERRTGRAPGEPDLAIEINATYLNSVDRWILGLPARRTVTAAGQRLEDVRMSYDGLPHGQLGAGLLTRRERLAYTQAQLDEVFAGMALPALDTLGYAVEPGPQGPEWWCDEYRVDLDPVGNVVTYHDPLGATTTVSYDADRLQPVRTTNPAGHVYLADYHPRLDTITGYVDPNGARTDFTYSPLGRVLAEHRPGDPDGEPAVRFGYQSQSLPVATVMERRRPGAAARRSVTYYDGSGNPAQTRARQDDGTFFVARRAVLDLRGLAVESHPGFVSASESFDPAEGLAPQRAHRSSFDALRRTVTVVDPAGHLARAVFAPSRIVFFDTQDTDPTSPFADTPRTQQVDAFGRLVGVTEQTPDGAVVTSYAYDPQGRLSAVVDAAGPLLSQDHDPAGRLLRVSHRDAGVRRFLRNARGAVVLYLDARGRQVAWTFDGIGRTTTVALDGVVTERLTYDSGEGSNLIGRLAHADDELGRQTFSYDAQGRTSWTTRTLPGQVSPFGYEFDYDVDGRSVRVRHPDGADTSYGYDALGRLGSVSGLIDSVEYDSEGRRHRVQYTGGIVATSGYDPVLGRLARQTIAEAAGPALLDQHFDYDSAGNLLRVDDLRPAGPAVAPASRSYAYDALNRLVHAQGGPPQAPYDHQFGYDAIGNLVRNDAWRPDPISYTGARLTGAGTDQFDYDANGCLVSRPGMTLEYDAREMLRRVTRADGMVIEFSYDPSARRLRKRIIDGATQQDTLYIGESFEVRPDGSTERQVCDPDGGAILVVRDGVALRTLFKDQLGSVIAIREAGSGAVHEVHYSAYGQPLPASGPQADLGDVLFAGRRFDRETGLYYLRMRYYDPALGRFISPDPLAVVDAGAARIRPLALNPYVYALDNPLRFTDVNGLWTFWEGFLTVLIVAAVVVATAATFGAAGVIALGIGAVVGGIIGGATTGSVDGALAGAMLGFSIVATVLGGVYIGAAIGGVFGAAAAGGSVGAFVGGFSAGMQLAGLVPAVRQNELYKDVLGWTSWINPWTWPGHIAGALIFIVNAIIYAGAYVFTWGEPPEWADMKVTFEQGMIVTSGGAIRPERAWNFGAFTSLNPNDPGVQNPTDRELILRHERGHSLANAYFGILQVGRIGAGDQTESFWEQLAESNVNPHDPSLTTEGKGARRRAGGRGFGSIPWWTPVEE